jgi:hypothetical protein
MRSVNRLKDVFKIACHSERSEESSSVYEASARSGYRNGFFAVLRMTNFEVWDFEDVPLPE